MKKKLLLLVVSLFCITMAVNAQDASGSCKLPGTYDYVNVDYYSDGHLAVSNQSEMKITQLHVKVTCTETQRRPDVSGDVPVQSQRTLVNQNYYDIPANQTTRITDGVKSCPTYETKNKNGQTFEITRDNFVVEVGNAMCK